MNIEREREREKGKITCKCTERKPRVCRSQCFLIIFRPKNKDAEQEMEKESMREGRGAEGRGETILVLPPYFALSSPPLAPKPQCAARFPPSWAAYLPACFCSRYPCSATQPRNCWRIHPKHQPQRLWPGYHQPAAQLRLRSQLLASTLLIRPLGRTHHHHLCKWLRQPRRLCRVHFLAPARRFPPPPATHLVSSHPLFHHCSFILHRLPLPELLKTTSSSVDQSLPKTQMESLFSHSLSSFCRQSR